MDRVPIPEAVGEAVEDCSHLVSETENEGGVAPEGDWELFPEDSGLCHTISARFSDLIPLYCSLHNGRRVLVSFLIEGKQGSEELLTLTESIELRQTRHNPTGPVVFSSCREMSTGIYWYLIRVFFMFFFFFLIP